MGNHRRDAVGLQARLIGPRAPLARPRQGAAGARTAGSGVRVVHRGVRHVPRSKINASDTDYQAVEVINAVALIAREWLENVPRYRIPRGNRSYSSVTLSDHPS
jgi:hypothetical protein